MFRPRGIQIFVQSPSVVWSPSVEHVCALVPLQRHAKQANCRGYPGSTLPGYTGCLSGAPLSLFLFLLSLKPFLLDLARASNVRGLQLTGTGPVKATLYADDETLFARDGDSVLVALRCSQAALRFRGRGKPDQVQYCIHQRSPVRSPAALLRRNSQNYRGDF